MVVIFNDITDGGGGEDDGDDDDIGCECFDTHRSSFQQNSFKTELSESISGILKKDK